MFPSVEFASDEHRLLIYGTDPAASFIPENLHVYCIFNPFRPEGLLCTRITVDSCLHTLVRPCGYSRGWCAEFVAEMCGAETISWLMNLLIQKINQYAILISQLFLSKNCNKKECMLSASEMIVCAVFFYCDYFDVTLPLIIVFWRFIDLHTP